MENLSPLNQSKIKTILMASTNYWNSPFQVGSHHLARGFIKSGWNVLFISDPISPLHPLGGVNSEFKERFKIYRNGGATDLNEKIWTYVPSALMTPKNRPLLKSKLLLKHWHRLTFPNLIKKIKDKHKGVFDLLYLDSPTQFFLLDSIPYQKSIYRVTDHNESFLSTPQSHQWAEQKIAKEVDLVIYSAASLKEYVDQLGPKQSAHVPNGINLDHFKIPHSIIPADLADIPKPIAIYVGALDYWFDYELLNEAAAKLPHVSFVLIGPKKLARKRLAPHANIYLLGTRPYEKIPQYLHGSDLGLIPFNVEGYPKLINGINPLKLYEYLACGLPVVASEWRELKALQTSAFLCKNAREFIESIDRNLDQKPNTPIKSDLNRLDWQNRVDFIIENLAQ